MLGGPELAEAVNTLPLEPVTGIFHRYVKHLFVAESLAKGTELHIVTGEWARKSGGRFNFPNQYRVSYLALDGETASAEAERGLAAPFIHVFVSGSIRNVLRLDDGTVRSALERLRSRSGMAFPKCSRCGDSYAATRSCGL
jgi:RES domain-containing protein